MHSYQGVVWPVQIIFEYILICSLIFQKTWRCLPWFTVWIAWQCLKSITMWLAKSDDVMYRALWAPFEYVFIALLACAGIEAYYLDQKQITSGSMSILISALILATGILVQRPAYRWIQYHNIELISGLRSFVSVTTVLALIWLWGKRGVLTIHSKLLLLFASTSFVTYFAFITGLKNGWTGSVMLTSATVCFVAWTYVVNRKTLIGEYLWTR